MALITKLAGRKTNKVSPKPFHQPQLHAQRANVTGSTSGTSHILRTGYTPEAFAEEYPRKALYGPGWSNFKLLTGNWDNSKPSSQDDYSQRVHEKHANDLAKITVWEEVKQNHDQASRRATAISTHTYIERTGTHMRTKMAIRERRIAFAVAGTAVAGVLGLGIAVANNGHHDAAPEHKMVISQYNNDDNGQHSSLSYESAATPNLETIAYLQFHAGQLAIQTQLEIGV